MILIHTISEERFDALVRGHIAFFRKLALRILKNREDADDAVQNALLKGWRRRLLLRNQERLLACICRIVVNESYDILRTRLNEKKMVLRIFPCFTARRSTSPSFRESARRRRHRCLDVP